MSQLQMYPAVVNSPMTQLSGAIDNVQNTIPLVDASVLPTGPNMCTIGSDETAETILYTGKSVNTLTGVTRGFQSAAKAWASGAKVARYLTAYDIDTFKANIEDLKSSVDSGDFKSSVRVATIANITLSGTQTIDGVAVVVGNRVLVKNQTTASQNGIYLVASGAWTRATDADTSIKVTSGMEVRATQGTVNGGSKWFLTSLDPVVLGTTNLTFNGVLNPWGDNTFSSRSNVETTIGATGLTFTNAGTFYKIPFATKANDNLNEYDTSLYRFTAKHAGKYHVETSVLIAGLAVNSRVQMQLFKNGADFNYIGESFTPVAGDMIIHGSVDVMLAVNDYIEIYVACVNTSGTTLTLNAATNYFQVVQIA